MRAKFRRPFGASPELVQGIIAGGATALYRSVEGAEDEENNGALAIDERGIKDVDVVIGNHGERAHAVCARRAGAREVVRRENDFAHMQSGAADES